MDENWEMFNSLEPILGHCNFFHKTSPFLFFGLQASSCCLDSELNWLKEIFQTSSVKQSSNNLILILLGKLINHILTSFYWLLSSHYAYTWSMYFLISLMTNNCSFTVSVLLLSYLSLLEIDQLQCYALFNDSIALKISVV